MKGGTFAVQILTNRTRRSCSHYFTATFAAYIALIPVAANSQQRGGLLQTPPLSQGQIAGATGLSDNAVCQDACSRVVLTGVIESVDRERGGTKPEGFNIRATAGVFYAHLDYQLLQDLSHVEGDNFSSWIKAGRRVTVVGIMMGQGGIFFVDTIIDNDTLHLARMPTAKK